ncbi:MAG: type IV secretory system conjugative DNA transfer family protein [Pseudomonadota bacterium]
MAKLLNFKSKRSPLQTSAVAFSVLLLGLLMFGSIPTQWFANKYAYDRELGQALWRVGQIAIYMPTDWIVWGMRYGDFANLKRSVHTMLYLGGGGVVLSMLFAVIVAQRMGRQSKGMDSLHGSARFAEWEDIDKTGFVDSRGHKAAGVIVGSVMLDSKGKVIHPHHPKFDRRYEAVMVRGTWREFYRKKPKRDTSNRAMFKVRKSVVAEVKLMRDGGNTHIFGFCPTRSGKGVGFVIPTLLTWPNSVMVNDPKGEAYALTSGFRKAAGQQIIKLAPASTDGSGAQWNPLDEIRIFTPHDVADAQMIMVMACDPEGKGLTDYFDKAGYEFMTALALHVRYVGEDGSLAGIANYLGDPNWDSDKQMFMDMMQSCHDPEYKMGWVDSSNKPMQTHPMVANAAKTMLNKEDKDRSGVLSTAKSLLSLYLDPIVAKNTSRSDFLVRDLMTGKKPVSLYYVVPSDQMVRMSPLTRLFYSLFIRRNAAEMEFKDGRSVAAYTYPLLAIIDEAASLQKLPILQEALGYVAGYGIRMFFLVQDIAQLEELYGQYQSFDSGAETRVAYAPNKVETGEKLARMTGKTTVTEDSANSSAKLLGIDSGNLSVGTSKTARDLITADEFLTLDDQDLVLFVKGKPPIYGRKAYYYENPTLQARASMAPPLKSDVLRTLQGAVETPELEAPPEPHTPEAKWHTAREAMRAKIDSGLPAQAKAPQATDIPYAGAERRSETRTEPATTTTTPATDRRQSRYVNHVQAVSPEEKQQIRAMVADTTFVDKVVEVSAF